MIRLGFLLVMAKTGSLAVPDVNVILNVACVLLLVMFGPRYLKTKDLQAQLGAKDRTIATHDQTIEAMEKRAAARESDLAGAQERAQKLSERNAKLSEVAHVMQGRYEEQSRYTAKEALATLERLLAHQGEEAERRHLELMAALGAPPPVA